MLTQKITDEELDFMECWHTPRCLVESLFSNFDNLSAFSKEKFGKLRLYQFPMISQEALIDFDTTANYHYHGLSQEKKEKKKFQLRKNVADLYNYGSRKYGKTLCTEKLDIPLSMLHDDNYPTACASLDSIHLRGVLEPVKRAIEYHPILKLWKTSHMRSAPNFEFYTKNGWKLEGVNMNLKSKNPGHQFYGKHVKKLWMEERSFETEEVAKKRHDALAEVGSILRFSGMTNFTRHSPAGKDFYAPENQKHIINYPQYVNPHWDEKEEENRVKKFGGRESLNYRVFVKGEIIEDGISEIDMDRVKGCWLKKKKIKRFEIKKKDFKHFSNLIVVERPNNADRILICADIGESAGTDIIILAEIGNTYKYLYNITLYNLIRKEQLEIFKWLITQLQANIIALDCGDAMGRNLADDLEEIYSKDNVVRYAGTGKVKVGFEKTPEGKIIIKGGKPIYREERVKEWAVRRLKHLLYEQRLNLPIDYKLEQQLASLISTKSGSRVVYECVSETGDHLFSAWLVFAIAQWLCKDFNKTKPMSSDWGTGSSSW